VGPSDLYGHQDEPKQMTKVRRISTDSIELALEQLVRSRTSGTKASIKPLFVMEVLKELIHWRREERSLRSEVDSLFSDDLILMDSTSDKPLRVVEVGSLSELGNSSRSGCDLREVEWKLPEEINEPEALDESDVVHEVRRRPILRTKHSSTSSMGVQSRWNDGSSTRRVIILVLIVVIILTIGPLLLI